MRNIWWAVRSSLCNQRSVCLRYSYTPRVYVPWSSLTSQLHRQHPARAPECAAAHPARPPPRSPPACISWFLRNRLIADHAGSSKGSATSRQNAARRCRDYRSRCSPFRGPNVELITPVKHPWQEIAGKVYRIISTPRYANLSRRWSIGAQSRQRLDFIAR